MDVQTDRTAQGVRLDVYAVSRECFAPATAAEAVIPKYLRSTVVADSYSTYS